MDSQYENKLVRAIVIDAALMDLGRADRMMLIYAGLYGMNKVEIAGVMGVHRRTVLRNLPVARERFAEALFWRGI